MKRTGKRIETEQQLQQSYDRIFTERGIIRSTDRFNNKILDLLQVQKGKRILDIGCAGGYFLMQAEHRGLLCHGIDISAVAIKEAKRNLPDSDIARGSGEKLKWQSNYFGYVSCLGVLEHFLYPEKGAREIARVLKPEGVACITVPNSRFIYWLLTRKQPNVGQDLERYATMYEWKQLLESNGLQIQKTSAYNVPASWKKVNPLFRILAALIPKQLSYHFIFLCAKR